MTTIKYFYKNGYFEKRVITVDPGKYATKSVTGKDGNEKRVF